jgi:Ankyrin repeat
MSPLARMQLAYTTPWLAAINLTWSSCLHDTKVDIKQDARHWVIFVVFMPGPHLKHTTQCLLYMGANVAVRSSNGCTPLQHASTSRCTRMTQLLLYRGADLEAPESDG